MALEGAWDVNASIESCMAAARLAPLDTHYPPFTKTPATTSSMHLNGGSAAAYNPADIKTDMTAPSGHFADHVAMSETVYNGNEALRALRAPGHRAAIPNDAFDADTRQMWQAVWQAPPPGASLPAAYGWYQDMLPLQQQAQQAAQQQQQQQQLAANLAPTSAAPACNGLHLITTGELCCCRNTVHAPAACWFVCVRAFAVQCQAVATRHAPYSYSSVARNGTQCRASSLRPQVRSELSNLA